MYVDLRNRFELEDYTKDYLKSLIPPFGYNGFGEFIFYRTYSRIKEDEGQEDWADCVIRVIEGVFTIRKDWYLKNHIHWDEDFWQQYATDFGISMFKMEWLPPGRGLWAMGTNFIYERGSMALYNCFSGDTLFLTVNGSKTFKETLGQKVKIIDSKNIIREVVVKSYGKQRLQKIIFKPFSSKGTNSNLRLRYRATLNHRWILENGIVTTNLRVGDVVLASAKSPFIINEDSQKYIDGFSHGLIFGDGCQDSKYQNRFMIRLCGRKNKYLETLLKSSNYRTHCRPPSYNEDFHVTLVTESDNLKCIPENKDPEYVKGFVDGWFAADSYKDNRGNIKLDTQNENAMTWIINNCKLYGYLCTGLHKSSNNITNYGKRSSQLLRATFTTEDVRYKVIDTNIMEEEEVYCIEEPITQSFTLAGGIPTGNCSFTTIETKTLDSDISWLMDSLMMGVGVGFEPVRDDRMELYQPKGSFDYVIPDTREGWAESTKLKILAYSKPGMKMPKMIYDKIRGPGLPIKGFGGISSGPAPLKELHEFIDQEAWKFKSKREYDSVYFKTNIANHTGCCVIAGNVRRSAELAKGKMNDPIFKDLKDYTKFPEREKFAYMSNNSVALETDEDFQSLGEIAKRVIMRGEPGYINMLNFPYARIGKKMKGLRKDKAIGINPCAEIPLENKETCNVAETCPTVSNDPNLWLKSCEYSTLYASTVSLLPTHQKDTNKVVAKNRRIGVSIIDWTGWKLEHGMHKVIGWMREGYKMVRSINKWANEEAGIPVSIRVTTIKPGGTGPKLPGRTPGIGHPTFDYTIRRVRVGKSSPVHELLVQANVPYEEDYFDKYTDVFEWPIIQGPAPPAEKVTLWEQAFNLVTVQREWSDNAVSNTLYFKPMWSLVKVITDDFIEILESYIGTITANLLIMDEVCEYVVPDRYKIQITRDEYQAPVEIKVYEYNPNHEENHIEPVLSCIAPLTKSVSLLPHSANGVYRQMPEEGITKEEYMKRYSQIHRIDWSKLSGSDGQDEQFCSAEGCIIREYK